MDVCHVVYTVVGTAPRTLATWILPQDIHIYGCVLCVPCGIHSDGHSSQNSSNMDSAPGYTVHCTGMCAMWYSQSHTEVGTAARTLATWILPPDIHGCEPCGIHSRTQWWEQLPELWQHGFCPRIYMDVSHVVYTVAHSGGNSYQNSGNMDSAPGYTWM